MDNESINILNEFIVPHIALTTFKYRAKAATLFKDTNAGITIDQFVVLKVLMQYPSIAQQELAGLLYKDKSNFSRLADDLERKGYITRKASFKGKRVVKELSVSQGGVELINRLTPLVVSLQKTAMEGICDDEIVMLKKILAKMRNNLDKIS